MFSDHCHSLVRSRDAPLLYADFYSRHSPDYELRIRCICRLLRYRDRMVLCLGQEEL